MVIGYYKKTVNYDGNNIIILFRVDEGFVVYLYSRAESKWIESSSHESIWEDLDYEKISEEDALKLIA